MLHLFLFLQTPLLSKGDLEQLEIFNPRFGCWYRDHGYISTQDQLLHLNAQGQVTARFAAKGPGPEEMGGPGPMALEGERLYFLDLKGRKLMWFSGDLQVQGSASMAQLGPSGALPVLKDNRLLLLSSQLGESGYSLHLTTVALQTLERLGEAAICPTGGMGMHSPPGSDLAHYYVYQTQIENLQLQLHRVKKESLQVDGRWDIPIPFQPPHGLTPTSYYLDKLTSLPKGPAAILTVSQMLVKEESLAFFLKYSYARDLAQPLATETQAYLLTVRCGGKMKREKFLPLDGEPLLALCSLNEPFFYYRPNQGLNLASLADLAGAANATAPSP